MKMYVFGVIFFCTTAVGLTAGAESTMTVVQEIDAMLQDPNGPPVYLIEHAFPRCHRLQPARIRRGTGPSRIMLYAGFRVENKNETFISIQADGSVFASGYYLFKRIEGPEYLIRSCIEANEVFNGPSILTETRQNGNGALIAHMAHARPFCAEPRVDLERRSCSVTCLATVPTGARSYTIAVTRAAADAEIAELSTSARCN